MTDIVERLQSLWIEQEPKLTWLQMQAVTDEAADEIERLRKENERLLKEAFCGKPIEQYPSSAAQDKDIVERLRSPQTKQGDMWPHPNLHEESADEIEVLRSFLKHEKTLNKYWFKIYKHNDELCEENERLREALKPFADAVLKDEYSWKYDINIDDFYAAAKALGEIGDE